MSATSTSPDARPDTPRMSPRCEGLDVGVNGVATSCVFSNSTFAAIKGDAFKDVGNFEDVLTIDKCEVFGAVLLRATDIWRRPLRSLFILQGS